MKIKIKNNIFSILILFILFLFFNKNESIKFLFKNDEDKISIVVNFKHITKDKHIIFYEIMNQLKSQRNYYFIKTFNNSLNENLNQLVENSTVKIVQSNFPDSIYIPLIVSLFGNNIPELILFIEGEDLMDNYGKDLIKWYNYAYRQLIINNYDYVFGGSQIINNKKIGCSLLLSKASIIQHLLYYTNADTTHINPFIQLSLANTTKFSFIPFKHLKISNIENTQGKFSLNMDCPSLNDNYEPSLCIMIPTFKRNYFSYSFPALVKQTYKPKFYVIIQNDDRLHFNISLFKNMVNEPVYHIWMQNWNSYFFLNLRISSVFPCDFVLKYDDDMWPKDNNLQEKLINKIKYKNIILGARGKLIHRAICGYNPKIIQKREHNIVDHTAVPLLIRPGYLKLDARNKIYRIFDAEDVHLSLNSWKLCNVTSKTTGMNLIEKQRDGNHHDADKVFISLKNNEKDVFMNTYCYLIRSGYTPHQWTEFKLPKKDHINITIEHKRLN